MSRRHRSTQVSEPICVGDVVSKLIEGVYDSLEPLKRDVSRVFANAIKYYGPDGAGRRLHEPSDCDDYVQRAQRFDAKESARLATPRPRAGPREGARPEGPARPPVRRLPGAGHRPSGAEIIEKLAPNSRSSRKFDTSPL